MAHALDLIIDQNASVDPGIAWSTDRDQVSHASSARAGRSRQCQSKWAGPREVHQERRWQRCRSILPSGAVQAPDDPGHDGNGEDDPDDHCEIVHTCRRPLEASISLFGSGGVGGIGGEVR
jgi:hypothetical protein